MNDYAAYCFAVNRRDLLLRAINTFPELHPDLTIVDNSERGDIVVSGDLPPGVYRYIPPVPLTYSQSMNWMMKDALARRVDFIIHFHSDMYSTNPAAAIELLEQARELRVSGRRWACLYSLHDLLWIINPRAAAAVGGWDTTFRDYFCDGSMRMRWERAGWERVQGKVEGVQHEGSATINSDPRLQFVNAQTFHHYGAIYEEMYGGPPGSERFAAPWNRPDLFPATVVEEDRL